jgi:hypothetical protein
VIGTFGQEFWSVREIADLLFGTGRGGIVLSLRANFDGSGKNDSPVLTVGGIVAWSDVCETTERLWNGALMDAGYCDEGGNAGVFHLADFGTEYCEYGSGSWDIETKRVPFIKNLSRIANRVDCVIASFSVETSQVKTFLEQCPHKEVYGPEIFSAAAILIFSYIEEVLDRFNDARIGYVFEHGDRQHEMNIAFEEMLLAHPNLAKFRSLGFLPKQTPILQVTDLVAGKINECLTRAVAALGNLDNGSIMTPVSNFDRYYSHDGTTAELMREDAGFGRHDCYVLNQSYLLKADQKLFSAIKNDPRILERRAKHKLWKPKHE